MQTDEHRNCETPDLSVESKRRLRRSFLLEAGTPDEQRRSLVNAILSTFQNPDDWPMTDEARIAVIKTWYRMAKHADETETA